MDVQSLAGSWWILWGLRGLWMIGLIAAAVEDIKERKIRNRLNLLIGGISLVTVILEMILSHSPIFRVLMEHLLSALLLSIPLLLANMIRKGSFGGGDIKLGFFAGWMLGFSEAFLALGISFILGAGWTIGLLFFRRHHHKSTLPFGPFMVLGMLVAMATC